MTFNVTNSNDSGAGSLREAITLANANPGQDNIVIKVANINLTSAINITDSVNLNGTETVINQTGSDRLFLVDNANNNSLIDVLFSNLSLIGGNSNSEGGAIYSSENLTLNRVTIEGNSAVGFGGGIFQTLGGINIIDSQLKENEAINDPEDNSEGGALAAINLLDDVKIANSSFEQNTANLGAILIQDAEAEVKDTKIVDNDSSGIAAIDSLININNVLVSGNNASGITGLSDSTLTIDLSTVTDNTADFGGGIRLGNSDALVTNSSIIGNVGNIAAGGLRISELSDIEIKNSEISGNSAPVGSGIETLEQSTAKIIDTFVLGNGEGEQLAGDGFTYEGDNLIDPAYLLIAKLYIGYQEPEEPIEPVDPQPETNLQLTTVNRFYQYQNGFHFYTANTDESSFIQAESEQRRLKYNYEGESFTALSSNKDGITGEAIAGAQEVYRFYNEETGAHMFTMDQSEKDFILENLDNYSLEGVAYYAFETEQEDIETTPLYRMLNTETGAHLFTSSNSEFEYVTENLDHFNVEANGGIAFYVMEL